MTLRRPLLLAAFFIVSGLVPLYSQSSGASDTVKYYDRTKDGMETTKIGEVKESAAGVTITAGGKTIAISPADVISVFYGSLPGVDDAARKDLPALEVKGAAEARNRYRDLLKTAATNGANERTRRFLEFKQALWAAKAADTKTGDEFRAEANAAVTELNTVARSYAGSWEVYPAARTAARLQTELGKFNEAAATLATLAKVTSLPIELQNEARIAEVDALFRSGSVLSAQPVAQALAKAKELTAVQRERLLIYEAALKGAGEKTDPAKVQAAAKLIHDQIDTMTDPVSRAVAHNALGELYLMANLPRDAMWEFLWVEAVHNSNRDEVAKALERLSQLFEKQGEKERAAVYREKLVKAKGG